ncbi:metallophosphoesterase [Bacillus luteolus]|uniref:Metallophosphoesterase n=1 Tax=Litchfieldia luteola TaxID=682179 RepID=A0ABR9QEM3_9BACI|nr:metallophosphoesterase [Cytobacillus luteolus]MBE4906948.1 metallophosphoesterase [Cytobacillus luteolus]MBP1943587.1 putative MPP superfamily phosphohydrolase [Cytobacillus luteolus]
MLRIVHFSDLHLDSNEIEDVKNFIVNPMIKDLKNYNEQKEIDLIVFSGDLIDKGGRSFGNDISLGFMNFEEIVIQPILNALNLSKDRFFFTIGNHDIDRNADSIVLEKGLEHTLVNISNINSYIDTNDLQGSQRVVAFKEFEKYFYEDFNGIKELSNFQSAFKIPISGIDIGITSFNSAWRCYDSDLDRGKIVLGERQITRARDVIKEADVKIGIIHHPLDFFAPFETRVIESMMTTDYDILLCGHVHEGSTWTKSIFLGTTYVSVSPSNWTTNSRTSDRYIANGYSIIDYDIDNSRIQTLYRRYSHPKESFVANTDIGDDTGKTVFNMPSSEVVKKRDVEKAIITTIREVQLAEIDEHLITYNTETLAPKKIEEMFVLPKITVQEEIVVNGDEVHKKEQTYNIEDICSSSHNILLVGGKEYGKTVLLDRILLEFTNNIGSYAKLPVYFDNQDILRTTRIETIISRYLNVGIREVKDLLVNHNLVLVIDNLSFDESNKSFLLKLNDFIMEFPDIQVIATCTSSIEGEIPAEALHSTPQLLHYFKVAFIKRFRTKEMRELMNKWFIGHELFDQPDKLQNLIKTFSTLNLPSTPLAVSMFLWIIETQENYKPINNATMLENFIERIFTKTSDSEIYLSEFNFKNKERLLTEIAYYMYEVNDINYRIPYSVLRGFIEENLRVKKFDYDEEELLRHFIRKGVLTIEKDGLERYVKFKFTCFFEFFLMKNIDINKKFKEHVFSEEHYLNFIEEIDYYTGLKRDEAELLQEFQKRMMKEYDKINTAIEKTDLGYDNVFETLKTITEKLDKKLLERISDEPKPSEEEFDHVSDTALESTDEKHDIVKKEQGINPLKKLEKMWVITAKVLKNTEETAVENLKTQAYRDIVKCSMAFVSLYKFLLDKYFEEQNEEVKPIDSKEGMDDFIRKFLPAIHQVVVYQTLGTAKLNIVIQEVIESIMDNPNVTDLEKFIAVFTYADLKGKDYLKYIDQLIKNIKRYYIKDMVFLKLINYYYQTKSKELEDNYRSLLGELIPDKKINVQSKAKLHRKGNVISLLKEKKLIKTKFSKEEIED